MVDVESLKSLFLGTSPYLEAKTVLSGEKLVSVKGLHGAAKSLLLALIYSDMKTPVAYFSSNQEEAEELKEELERLVGTEFVTYFPASVFFGTGFDHHNHETTQSRLSTLEALTESKKGIVVSHASGFLHQLPTKSHFSKKKISLDVGDRVDFELVVMELVEMGFVRESRVEHVGEMCVRGGLIDVYPYSATNPYRIEFWDDEIESIRTFDPDNQRSLETIEKFSVYPQEIERNGEDAETEKSSLLNYLPENCILALEEPDLLKKAILDTEQGLTKEGNLTEENLWGKIEKELSAFKRLEIVSIGQDYDKLVDFNSKSTPSFKGSFETFKERVSGLSSQNPELQVLYSCDSKLQSQRMEELFAEEDINFANVKITNLSLHHGFEMHEENICVYTDHEFYGRSKRLRLPQKRFKGLTPKQLKHLNLGDYIVHVDFGVGIFRGLKKIDVHGHERECLQIEYRGKDMVYVRVERMDRVNKYSSKESSVPTLNKLGSPEWQKLKGRTKKKIKDIAKELIRIYVQRKSRPGHAFDPDNLWQRELEASFPHEDTPDQVKATEEVKEDMQTARPMDRLICGDVGFGKTEIAIRAAFKAVVSGKQVAILVPTTILAYQHYHTFEERLEKFPMKVEMLSRFRTRAEQKVIIAGLKAGDVDIVIGTHRLFSKDIEFKELGLLIIDEEHRFGVSHKEKLKKMRTSIDVLTLTATPIPRTLQFSLMGARDMTMIMTPPRNRLPIITEILPFKPDYIREVILRELERDGQIFFVHNRVRSIDRVAQMVSELIPEATVAVAHGQMNEKELEKVMVEFMDHKYQILVSTMIIESGLDMPNVNTIIINRADKLGLAQLHQLRGRIGRSHQRAYAYLIIPPIETLSLDALKRLRAIEEFSEIGAGSHLAMRDLEIRGAGNMLGAEQTGFIDTLGFDLYNKILDEAVVELKEEELPPEKKQLKIDTQVDIDFDAFLPETYVSSGSERVDIYRRLTAAVNYEDVDEIFFELQDRFGKLPIEVKNLLNFIAIRCLGKKLGLRSINISQNIMLAQYDPEFINLKGEQFKNWLGSIVTVASQPFEFLQNNTLGIRVLIPKNEKDKLSVVSDFLKSISNTREPSDEILA